MSNLFVLATSELHLSDLTCPAPIAYINKVCYVRLTDCSHMCATEFKIV